MTFCLRARSSALRNWALARGRDACAGRFDLRSAATFLRNATSSSFCSCVRSSALRSRAFSRFRESTSWRSALIVSFLVAGAGAALRDRGVPPGAGMAVSFPASDACKASRNWKTSMRSDVIVLRLRESTPACESNFSSRVISAW